MNATLSHIPPVPRPLLPVPRGSRGFTLIEILMAVMVVGFGLSIFLSAMYVGMQGVGDINANNTATSSALTLYNRLVAKYNMRSSTDPYALDPTGVDEVGDLWTSLDPAWGTKGCTTINTYKVYVDISVPSAGSTWSFEASDGAGGKSLVLYEATIGVFSGDPTKVESGSRVVDPAKAKALHLGTYRWLFEGVKVDSP